MEKPSRWENFFIYYFASNLDLYSSEKRVFEALETLAFSRNGLAHELGAISIIEIKNKLGIDYNTEMLFDDIEKILHCEKKDFGIYDDIKAEIENLL